MTTISVPDMMCENCVKRITTALTAANLTFQVSLQDKTVTIDGCEHCVKTALGELEDLGFTPGSPGIKRHLPPCVMCLSGVHDAPFFVRAGCYYFVIFRFFFPVFSVHNPFHFV